MQVNWPVNFLPVRLKTWVNFNTMVRPLCYKCENSGLIFGKTIERGAAAKQAQREHQLLIFFFKKSDFKFEISGYCYWICLVCSFVLFFFLIFLFLFVCRRFLRIPLSRSWDGEKLRQHWKVEPTWPKASEPKSKYYMDQWFRVEVSNFVWND